MASKSIPLSSIPAWSDYILSAAYQNARYKPLSSSVISQIKSLINNDFPSLPPSSLSTRISLYRGDITKLSIDAIVNAANSRLWAGGGVCGAIHDAAGRQLAKECNAIGYCEEGNAVLTDGYDLPAKKVIHAVGPSNGSEKILRSAYQSILSLSTEHNLQSIAIPCISTGIYGYPNLDAAIVAIKTTRHYLEKLSIDQNPQRVIFAVFLEEDFSIYHQLIPLFFPVTQQEKASAESSSSTPSSDHQNDSSSASSSNNVSVPSSSSSSSEESKSENKDDNSSSL